MHSIIIPSYKSSKTIREVVTLTAEELQKLGIDSYEFILVNDCSPDEGETWRELKKLAEEYPYVRSINLAKNAGQHNALMAGLNYARGEILVSMDDDMQTHPSQLHKLFDELDKGYDMVYGYYPDKKHSFMRRIVSKLNDWSVRVLIGKPKWLKTSSYWVMRKYVRDYVIQYKHSFTYMQGLILRSTSNISNVPIEHFERSVGTSGYTIKKLFGIWASIIGFSIVPLRLVTILGLVFAVLGFLGGIAVIISKLLNPQMLAGWASIISCLCFFSGVSILGMGLVGEYVGRIFLSVNEAPQYVVREIVEKTQEGE